MHPDYRKGLVKLLADADQQIADLTATLLRLRTCRCLIGSTARNSWWKWNKYVRTLRGS
jgi:hypothetical protein